MQFQVPQFIETEDKIVGPFTMRQFIYVAVAGAFGFILYFAVQLWLFIIVSSFLFGLALSLAFVTVNSQPLTRVILAAFNFYWKPQAYVWQPEQTETKKGEAAMRPLTSGNLQLEDIVSGMALRKMWQGLQTGMKISDKQYFGKRLKEQYEVFQRLSGEREAARRIDYR